MFPLEKAIEHAKACYPLEACGLWIENTEKNVVFLPCEPSKVADRFIISPQKWLEAERTGSIKGIFHSHPDTPPVPSPADVVAIDAWGLPWVIMSVPSLEYALFEPRSEPKALLGRTFRYGTDDCYGLIRDYYHRLGIDLPDIRRWIDWEKQGHSLYLDNYEKAGFKVVEGEPELHDMLVIQMNSPVPNHGAIYLGDNRILHHIETRLSARAVYGDYYRKATTHVMRHRELC